MVVEVVPGDRSGGAGMSNYNRTKDGLPGVLRVPQRGLRRNPDSKGKMGSGTAEEEGRESGSGSELSAQVWDQWFRRGR